MKLRFILPVVNVAISSAALVYENLRGFAGKNPEPSPPLLACYLINAPVLVIQQAVVFVLGKLAPKVCSQAGLEACYRAERVAALGVFVLGVGALWYLVGRAIEAERPGVRIATFRNWRRKSLGAVVILFAILCGTIGVLNWKERSYPLNLPLPSLAYTLWALLLAVLCGRDLVRSAHSGTETSSSRAGDSTGSRGQD
jgi:hypothetical protein